MSEEVFTYRLDGGDTIVALSDNWHAFAVSNDWGAEVAADAIVGRKLWDFIRDPETRHVYAELFKRVRDGQPPRAIPFRCDSPQERRYLELLIEALPDGGLAITSRILRTESRSHVSLLDAGTARSAELITICSMCKKIKVSAERWAEIEDGLGQLKLFEGGEMPQLSHGLCGACYNVAMGDLEDFKARGG